MPTSSPRQIRGEPKPPTTRKRLAPDSPVHPVSLLAGAGSAAIAAVIGGQLGLGGTVIGAAIGSLVAAVTATTIRASVHRSRAAAIALANRRRSGVGAVPIDTVAAEHADPARPQTPWSGWVRGAVTVGAGFALGIVGLLLVQHGLGTNLSPGTDQLQSVAARVVAPGPASVSSTPSAHPTATATTTVTETASATPTPSATASQTADPMKAPTNSAASTASAPASGNPAPSAGVPTP